jgi:WD40 repeat protein
MRRLQKRSISAIALTVLHGCVMVPVPVSTDLRHPRASRAIAVEISAPTPRGAYSAPAFDPSGERLAVFDSSTHDIQVRRTDDLSLVASVKPDRWARRLTFSPSGRFLIAETHVAWMDDHIRSFDEGRDWDLRDREYQDNIQQAEVWALDSSQRLAALSCDGVQTSEPQHGWLWAREKTLLPGFRTSALLAARFTSDESKFEAHCWTGVTQRWDTTSWTRLPDLPATPTWTGVMPRLHPGLLVDNGGTASSADGSTLIVRALEPGPSNRTAYLWPPSKSTHRRWPSGCALTELPVQSLSKDGRWAAALCNSGLGSAVNVWETGRDQDRPVAGADFGLMKGGALIRSAGVALSPDGRYLAVAVLSASQWMVITPLPGLVGAVEHSDLRLWRLSDDAEIVSMPVDDLIGSASHFRGVDIAISPATDRLAVAGRKLRLYRMVDLDASMN